MSLLESRRVYKPFAYPWSYEAWEMQNKIHWLAEEVPLGDDVQDWQKKMTNEEKNLLTQIFRLFTQMDIDISDCYMSRYLQVFKPTEVRMMLSAFANAETIHVAAYSHLLDTIGMHESEYGAFLKYKEMKDKSDYMSGFDVSDKRSIARTLAGVSAFGEGVALFASFAILLNFTRFGKMKGMGQIVSWSIRDESLHCQSLIKLFRAFIQENPEIWDDALKSDIYTSATKTVEMEDAFINLAFEQGGIEGLNSDEVKQYIRCLADRRLLELGMKPIFGVKDNPLPWIEHIIGGVEFVNFFENRATEYSKAATKGTWDGAYDEIFSHEKA